jgi:hypothetical protein
VVVVDQVPFGGGGGVPQLEVEVAVVVVDEGFAWRALDEGLVHRRSYVPFVWVLPLGIDLSPYVACVHNVGVSEVAVVVVDEGFWF